MAIAAVLSLGCSNKKSISHKEASFKTDDNIRAEQIKEMRFGMFPAN